jgi:hypothetical protein
MARVPVAEFAPDLPQFEGGGQVAQNVYPAQQSYLPVSGNVVYSTPLTARAQGYITARALNGTVFNYAGDTTQIYQLSAQSFVSVATATYATAIDDFWEFVQFGQFVIGANFTDNIQSISMGAASFAPLAGAPPKAKHLAVVNNFVVAGNLATDPTAVQWSAINNSASWTANAVTQADMQTLPDTGWVQKVVSGEYGVIFTDSSIWRMDYVGSPLIFAFRRIETKNSGTPCPQSVISYKDNVFYLSPDGFAVFNGAASTPIGEQKVDRTFFSRVDQSFLYRVQAAVDPYNKRILWAYPTSSSINGNPDRILVYDITTRKWSEIVINLELLVVASTQGYTLEGLDSVSASIDALTYSLDSRIWTGGVVTLGLFDSSHRLNYLSGTPLQATVDTIEYSGRESRIFLSGARPLVDDATATIQIAGRDALNASLVWGVAAAQNNNGYCPFRANNRYLRARITTGGPFTHIQGIEADVVPNGIR